MARQGKETHAMFEIDREKYQDMFISFLEEAGFDDYGIPVDETLRKHLREASGTEWLARDTDIPADDIRSIGSPINDPEELRDLDLPAEKDDRYYRYNGNTYLIYQYIELDDGLQTILTEDNIIRIIPEASHHRYFDNGTFMVNPYYWGDSASIAKMANFAFHPSHFEISWYKYPFRGSYANRPFGEEEFRAMLDACLRSL